MHLCDFIPVRPNPKLIENAELARKYRKSSLSAQQLADEYGVSKQMILGRLREAGVRGGKGHGDAVWKTIAEIRRVAISNARQDFGCPSIFNKDACSS